MDFSICHDTVPLQIKIESCSNNNCNSNKDIKKAKYTYTTHRQNKKSHFFDITACNTYMYMYY